MTRAPGLQFTKLHGLGNDFFVVDLRRGTEIGSVTGTTSGPLLTPEFARKVCDRRAGISVSGDSTVGADGILMIKAPQDPRADARMEILNADGSTAEMCGNGIRVVALHLALTGSAPKMIETLAGPIGIEVQEVGTDQGLFTVDMGAPRSLGTEFLYSAPCAPAGAQLTQHQHRYLMTEVDMGNPHAVTFEDGASGGVGFSDLDGLDLRAVGEPIEHDPRFKNRTNVEFVRIVSRNHLRVRVWERGSGETQACGTGACAAAVVALARGWVENPVTVTLPGGDLVIEWTPPQAGGLTGATGSNGSTGSTVKMTGPAAKTGSGFFSER